LTAYSGLKVSENHEAVSNFWNNLIFAIHYFSKVNQIKDKRIRIVYLSIPISVRVNIYTQTDQMVMKCVNGHIIGGNLQ